MANPEWDNYKTPEPRFRIIGDDSGHKYFVQVGDEEEVFAWWLSTFEEDYDEEFDTCGEYVGPDFNERRIEGLFTFTDPRNN